MTWTGMAGWQSFERPDREREKASNDNFSSSQVLATAEPETRAAFLVSAIGRYPP